MKISKVFPSLSIVIVSFLIGWAHSETLAAASNPERGTIAVKVRELKNGSLTANVNGKLRKVDIQAIYTTDIVFMSPSETIEKSCTVSANAPLFEELNPGIDFLACSIDLEKAVVAVTYQRFHQAANTRVQGDIEIKRNSQLVMTATAEGLLVLFDDTNPIFDPVIMSVNGPLLEPRNLLINESTELCSSLPPLLQPSCIDLIADVANLLVGYAVSGTGTPNALLTVYVSPTCEVGREWRQVLGNDLQEQVSIPPILDLVSNLIIDQVVDFLNGLEDPTVDADGNFTIDIVLASQAELTATVMGPMSRPCSNAIALPSL